jgi:membrane protein YdbS with pleckstrin-like domain
MDYNKTQPVEHITSIKELVIHSFLLIALSIGSTWVSIVTDEVWIKSLSFISVALIIIVNLVKLYKDLFKKSSNHERKEK